MLWKVVNYLSVAHDFWWGSAKSRRLIDGDCTFYPECDFSVSMAEPQHPNFWSEGHQRMTDLHRWFAAFEPLYASVPHHTRS